MSFLYALWLICLLMAFAEAALGGGRMFMNLTGHLSLVILWCWVLRLIARILGFAEDRLDNDERDKKSG